MRTIEGGGAQIRLGANLASAFERAGLSTPTLRLEFVIASGLAAIDAIHLVTDLVATLLPSMERMGIVKASEVALPTLAQRILAEVGADGTLVGRRPRPARINIWVPGFKARRAAFIPQPVDGGQTRASYCGFRWRSTPPTSQTIRAGVRGRRPDEARTPPPNLGRAHV